MKRIRHTHSMMTVGFSGITSSPIYVGDADDLSLSLISATAASAYTVQGSNHDGFLSAIPAGAWSTMTVLTAQGIYGIQPGVAWMRAIESTSSSSATMLVVKQS